MKGFTKVLFIAIIVFLVGRGFGQGPTEEYERGGTSPELRQRIQDLIASLPRAAPYDRDRSFAKSRAARELIELGPPSVPFLVSAMKGEKALQGGYLLMAMRVIGEIGVAKKADVVLPLCEFLESSVSDISYHTGGDPARIRRVESEQACAIAIGEGAADYLARIGDPQALECLLGVIEATQEKADLEYATEERPAAQRLDELYAAGHAGAVLEAAVAAIAALPGAESHSALEQLTQSTGISVRVAARCARAESIDGEAAAEYLREAIKTEKHPKAKERYQGYIDEVISLRKVAAPEAGGKKK